MTKSILSFLILFAAGTASAEPGVIVLEKKDERLNIFQLVKTATGDKVVYSLVKRDKNGRFEWMVEAWQQKPGSEEYGFLLTVNKNGSLISRWTMKKDDPGINLGLFVLPNTVSVILNLNERQTSRGALEPFEQALTRETEELRQKYYPQVCGVLAFLRIMNTEQQTTSGEELMSLITRKEPDFSERCPKISKGLTLLGEVTHREGKVFLKVNEHINIDNIRIYEGSRFSIVQGDGGNLRLVVEEGIQVTKSIGFTFKKPLNFVDVEAFSGHLTFNYGKNKSKRVLIDEILKR